MEAIALACMRKLDRIIIGILMLFAFTTAFVVAQGMMREIRTTAPANRAISGNDVALGEDKEGNHIGGTAAAARKNNP